MAYPLGVLFLLLPEEGGVGRSCGRAPELFERAVAIERKMLIGAGDGVDADYAEHGMQRPRLYLVTG